MVPFITGNHGGNFCSRCPVVVLNTDAFAKTALAGGSSKIAFTVAGIVDLDEIPEEKQHIPLGEDDNPIPLVEFLNNKDGSKKNVAQSIEKKDKGQNHGKRIKKGD